MLGFGTVGQAALPLVLRHLELDRERITIVTASEDGRELARACGVADFRCLPLSPANYAEILGPLLAPGGFLLNLSVDVSSVALVELCHERGALYLDSCVEPWAGGYVDTSAAPAERSNWALRARALAINDRTWARRPTAVLTHGVNPGLVSHFTKEALLQMARDVGQAPAVPASREEWAALARSLGIKVVHVAERDWQVPSRPKEPGEFVNTWSVEAFVGEGCQPAELGWGTHEKRMPPKGREHPGGDRAAIYLERPGVAVRVRSWTPFAGPYHGFLVTHAEAISIADYLTLRAGERTVYRPTVHYAYHPCDAAVLSLHEFSGADYRLQARRRLLRDDIVGGIDELGVLLGGNPKGVYWYGSRLGIDEARRLDPSSNATTLQTAAGVLSGMVWALENDERGVIEPDEMDYARVLEIARPYLGTMVGVWGDWTPLSGRQQLFEDDIDPDDPWQFTNVLVAS